MLYNHGYRTLTFCKLCEKNITSINNISKRPTTFNENTNDWENIEFTESTDPSPISSYLICSVEINSSDNESVHNFRLSFLFSILFPLAKSRFSVWCPCWWRRKLTDFTRTEWNKMFDSPDHSVVSRLVSFSMFSFVFFLSMSCVCNLGLGLGLGLGFIQISGKDLSVTGPEKYSSTCF